MTDLHLFLICHGTSCPSCSDYSCSASVSGKENMLSSMTILHTVDIAVPWYLEKNDSYRDMKIPLPIGILDL
jgi:hypothetical protein